MPFRSPFDASTALPTSNNVATRRRIGLLSTYPPKLCGLATFAAALEGALTQKCNQVHVVRIDDGDETPAIGNPVAGELVNGAPGSIRKAATVLSRCDVAIIQHEYGIYGGADGDEVLELIDALDVPVIVVLHTVPLSPTPHQRSVLEDVCAMADRVVVMTESANDRLTASYVVDSSKVTTIPHGASRPNAEQRRDREQHNSVAPQLLTWGLLGPGKGIEHVVDALALLGDMHPRPRYTIAGVTHPKVFAQDGDVYRHSLIRRCWATGVASSVTFDDTYRNVSDLTRFVASASVVVLPYDSRDQVTSGVLVDAIAAGRPVIATAFPHAVELLSSGAGIIVPHADPQAMAAAIRSVVSDAGRREAMAAEARRIGPSLGWAAVADQYLMLSDQLTTAREPVAI
jgi:polysaccharide biosynthesis protein PslF